MMSRTASPGTSPIRRTSPPTSPILQNLSPESDPVQDNYSPESSPRHNLSFQSEISPQSSPVKNLSPPSEQDRNLDASSPLSHVSVHSASSSTQSCCEWTSTRKRKRYAGSQEISRTSLHRRLFHINENTDEDIAERNERLHQLPVIHCPIDNEAAEFGQYDGTLSDSVSSSSSDEETSESEIGSDVSLASHNSNSISEHSTNTNSESDCSESETAHASVVDSENGDSPSLYEGSNITSDEAFLDVLKLYLKERWTKTSLHKNIKLIKRLLPQPNELPNSYAAIFKKLEERTTFFKHNVHYFCSNCQASARFPNQVCENCECSKVGEFFSFPLDDQIKHMFEQRGLATIMDYFRQNHDRKEGFISDILDGSEYKTVKQQLLGQYDIVLLWNTDGVSLSSSSKQELWGILCTICEIPPRLRPYFTLVCGVCVSDKKPNMNVILQPFVDSLNNINENGVSWIHPETKLPFKSVVVAPILCADAPAKAMVLNVNYYSSKYGCNVCEQKAVKVDPNPPGILLHPSLKKRKKRRLVYQEEVARLRMGPRMNVQGHLAEIRAEPCKGVKGSAVVADIPYFDRALCVSAEYLHIVCLGVVKYFLHLFLFVKGPWYIGDHINEIDSFISDIKVPDFVKRLPRSLAANFKFLKANELRAILLFYSLPAFKNYLPNHYFQHWLLLVGAMHILLSDCISQNDLASAEIMLRCFVRDVADLFGEKYYTYNLHNLLHLTVLIRRWGPLWGTSAFSFETYNGFIGSHLHGTKHLGQELLNNIKIAQQVAILENSVKQPVFAYPRPRVPSVPHDFQFLGKSLSNGLLSNREATVCNAQLGYFTIFSRVKVRNVFYTSKKYDESKKRSNSFIQFTEPGSNVNGYGEILYFLRAENGTMHCLVDTFRIEHVNIFYEEQSRFRIKNLLPVSYSGVLLVLSVDCIRSKVLKVGMYLGIRPNSIEVNL